MAYTDTMGYIVSTTSSEALAAYEQGVSLWLCQRSVAVEALDHAVAVYPHFPPGHCTRAYVAWCAGKNEDSDAGLALGLPALKADPGNLYTYHAVGHNYQARGDYCKALATFERAN